MSLLFLLQSLLAERSTPSVGPLAPLVDPMGEAGPGCVDLYLHCAAAGAPFSAAATPLPLQSLLAERSTPSVGPLAPLVDPMGEAGPGCVDLYLHCAAAGAPFSAAATPLPVRAAPPPYQRRIGKYCLVLYFLLLRHSLCSQKHHFSFCSATCKR